MAPWTCYGPVFKARLSRDVTLGDIVRTANELTRKVRDIEHTHRRNGKVPSDLARARERTWDCFRIDAAQYQTSRIIPEQITEGGLCWIWKKKDEDNEFTNDTRIGPYKTVRFFHSGQGYRYPVLDETHTAPLLTEQDIAEGRGGENEESRRIRADKHVCYPVSDILLQTNYVTPEHNRKQEYKHTSKM